MPRRRLQLALCAAPLLWLSTSAGSPPASAASDQAANPSAADVAANSSEAADVAADQSQAADVAAARALFEKNLAAIRNKDRDGYLSCYLKSDHMVAAGADGPHPGYDALAAAAGQGWPDYIEAADIHLTPIRPGLVHATYRYNVRFGAEQVSGLSERLFLKTGDGWKIAATSAFAAPPGVPAPPRALLGATLVDGTGAPPVRDAAVLLRDGRIECAGPRAACPVPAGTDSVDLSGLWITPGLIDAHVHFSQTGWADGRPDSLDLRAAHPYEEVEAGLRLHPEHFGRSYLCSGVTAVFDVGGYPWTLALPAWAEDRPDVPRIAAAGPLLSTLDFWLNLPAERQFVYLRDADAARQGVTYLADQGAAAVKVWYIVDPQHSVESSTPAVMAAGEEARRRQLPLIVHATGLAEAKVALRAGAKVLVHSVWDLPVDDEFLALARRNGAIYCPTLTVIRGYGRMFESAAKGVPPAIDDPNGCVNAATRAKLAETARVKGSLNAEGLARTTAERLARMKKGADESARIGAANLARVAAAGIPIAMGTDAGNPLTLHGPAVYAEMEAMQAAGLTPMQVLVASTRGGAAAMGRLKELGTVEKGKLADLLVVAADPATDVAHLRQVRYVVRGGAMVPIGELAARATAVPTTAK